MSARLRKIIGIILSGIALFAAQLAPAQGTLYLSNVGQPSAGSLPVGNDHWIATRFNTGTNSMGYVLDSIQLSMQPASGSPSGFGVFLYDINIARQPGNSLGSLSGSDPAAGGIFTYTASGITLSPLGAYYVVITSATAVANGPYRWSQAATSVYDGIGRWTAFGNSYTSSDGSAWTRQDSPYQFAVYGTAVPEPTAYALAGLGLVCLSFWRRKHTRKVAR